MFLTLMHKRREKVDRENHRHHFGTMNNVKIFILFCYFLLNFFRLRFCKRSGSF